MGFSRGNFDGENGGCAGAYPPYRGVVVMPEGEKGYLLFWRLQ